jgi:hypothetical protein
MRTPPPHTVALPYGLIFEEKPQTLPSESERAEQNAFGSHTTLKDGEANAFQTGVVTLQDARVPTVSQLTLWDGHESDNGHGTTQNRTRGIGSTRSRLHQLMPSVLIQPAQDWRTERITTPVPIEWDSRSNHPGNRLRWAVRSRRILSRAECHIAYSVPQ